MRGFASRGEALHRDRSSQATQPAGRSILSADAEERTRELLFVHSQTFLNPPDGAMILLAKFKVQNRDL